MRPFKNIVITLVLSGVFNLYATAGDITPGAVPGSLSYQGRLEKDNAPVTGSVHLIFRIYNGLTEGVLRWTSPEAVVNAAQGIFSASIIPPWKIFSAGETLYLEVQVETNVLSPREPLNSVAYALVAKKLEDGASVSVTTLTASNQVLLASEAGSKVGIGTTSPDYKLTVDGSIKLMNKAAAIYFFDGTSMVSSSVGVAVGGITSPGDATIVAGNKNSGGDIIFSTAQPSVELARLLNNGNFGIGTSAPMGKLDVNGSLYVSNAGIYDRDDGELNVKQDLVVEGGRIRGTGNNYISMGETADTIIAATNNTPRLWLDSSGNLGVGATAAPSERIYSNGNIRSDTGLRGSAVSVGAYTGWTSLANEVRGQTDLLLQQSNSYNVGIGTDTPREKLHVHGSVKADYGVIAATAAFSDSVSVDVNGNFTANSGHNTREVYLSSTVIYGSLLVTGSVGGEKGFPAYIYDNNTFENSNTFKGLVTVSTDIIVSNRIGAGARDFDFGPSKYLQIGDNKPEFAGDDAAAYLVAGTNADARIFFHRGDVEAARLETRGTVSNPALALMVGNTKSVVDNTYYRIQNSVVIVSTGDSSVETTTPAIYVSSTQGNIGMGTAVLDPNHRLTVEGNIRISGQSHGLIFADGTSINSGAQGSLSVGSVSNNNDAIVQSDADLTGGGKVILRAGAVDGFVLTTGGNIGIGTANPSLGKVNLIGGDLVLGTPSLIGASDKEDLFVAGNVIVDGGIVQRSNTPMQLTALTVSGNVFLSTTAAAGTRLGSDAAPAYKLDVTGDINASATIKTGGITRITAAGAWNGATITVPYGGTGGTDAASARAGIGLGTIATQNSNSVSITGGSISGITDLALADGGTGADLSGASQGGIIYKTAGGLDATSALTGVLRGNGSSAPTPMTGTASTVARWTDANTIGISTISDNGTDVGISVAPTTGIKLDVNGKLRTATFQIPTGGASDAVLTSDAGGNATWKDISTNSKVKDPFVGNEVVGPTNQTLTLGGHATEADPSTLALNLGWSNTWTVAQTFNAGITAEVTGDVSGTASNVTGTILVGHGGTGLTVGTAGGLPYFSATTTMGSTGLGSSGQALLSAGTGVPTWGTLSASYGGTGQSGGYVVGDILYASAAGTLSKLADVATGNALLSGGTATAPSYGKIGLTTHVTGTLPVANGGTGAGTLTGIVHGTGTGPLSAGDVDLTSEVTGTLPVLKGGTGRTAMPPGGSGKIICWTAAGALGVCVNDPVSGVGTCTCN